VSAWKITATVLAGMAGVVLALLLAGWSHGLVLLAYVLFVSAVALLVLAGRLRAALPPATPFEELLAAAPRRVQPVGQLESIRQGLAAASWSRGELHYRLAPMIREIAAARLSRRHGVDLDRQPERARALIGDGRVWELAGPRRGPPENRRASGWSRRELEELLDELEEI
jgi:hypothetical protein